MSFMVSSIVDVSVSNWTDEFAIVASNDLRINLMNSSPDDLFHVYDM